MEAARSAIIRRGVRLETVTIAWMALEAAASIGAGIAARSVLLTAFGVDSVVELLSGVVLYRRLTSERSAGVEDLERNASRASAVLLILLCAYVVLSSAAGLLLGVRPDASWLGLGIAIVALIAMPLLALAKSRVNVALQSPALRADIVETLSCAYLAGVTLVGLGASMAFGWWWAQYAAALSLLVWLIPEAREAFERSRIMRPTTAGTGKDET